MALHRQPLFATMDGYELHSLECVSEEAFAEIFQEVCQRGNPLLQGKPNEQLLNLGRLMYERALQDPLSTVMTTRGAEQVVAVCTTWNMQGGSLWNGFEVPEALRGHAAVAAACCASVPLGKVHFAAFGGARRGYPKELLGLCLFFSILGGARLGYNYRFGYTVHPRILAWMAESKGFQGMEQKWEVPFSDVDADAEVKRELGALKPDYATCTLMDLRLIRNDYNSMLAMFDAYVRPFIEDLNKAVHLHVKSKGVLSDERSGMVPETKMRAAPVSSKL